MTLSEFAIEIPAIRDEARVLWGEQLVESWNDYDRTVLGTGWKFHLIEMLISDDSEQYLKDNM